MASYLSTPLGYIAGLQMECVRQIEAAREKMREGKDVGRETIFATLLDPEEKPNGYVVPTTWQLNDEAYSIPAAASETTGGATTVATFNVLSHPHVYEELSAEISSRFPDSESEQPFLELEKLPYLTAVVKESQRLAFGVIGRLPRVVPPGGAEFNGHFIPEGYVVGMSSWLMHREPTIWRSDPLKFDPERWLESEAQTRRLERYLVPFGKGSRQCVGINLAQTELHVMLGTFFRRFEGGLKVWKTDQSLFWDYVSFFNIYHPYSRRDEWLKVYKEKGI